MLLRFYNARSAFLTVNAILRWLNNVSSVYLVQVLVAEVRDHMVYKMSFQATKM